MNVPVFRSFIPEPRVVFTGKAFDCEGGDERCYHPAPYRLRDFRHRTYNLCIKHLTEYRLARLTVT